MCTPKNLSVFIVLAISCLLFVSSGSSLLAQSDSNQIVHLPIFLDSQFNGFEPPEIDTDFEQVLSAPLAAVSDHSRSDSYLSSITFFNPYSTITTIDSKSYDNDGTLYSGSATYFVYAFDSLTLFPIEQGVNGVTFFPERTASGPLTAIYTGFKDVNDDSYYATRAPSPSTQIYLPLLCKCDYETVIGIKNTNDADAIVTIEYSDGETTTVSVPAHTHRLIYQFLGEHGNEPFSGILTSSVPVMASVLQTDSSTSRGYAGIIDSSSDLIFPFVSFDAASTTFATIQIQNAGSESTEIDVTYRSMSSDPVCTQTQMIEAGASTTFMGSDCSFGDGFIGSARVTANSTDQPLAGVVDQFQNDVGIGSYSGTHEEGATNKVAFPAIIQSDEEDLLRNTWLRITNVGSMASNVTCYFTGSERIETSLIPAGGTIAVTLAGEVDDFYSGAATCVGNSSARLAAIVDTQYTNEPTAANGMNFAIYRGINF